MVAILGLRSVYGSDMGIWECLIMGAFMGAILGAFIGSDIGSDLGSERYRAQY
jgi:hypothetical protein